VKETFLARPRHSLEDNIKMDLKFIGRRIVNRIHLVQDRDWCQTTVNTEMNLQAL
jgi:hypothetical protein